LADLLDVRGTAAAKTDCKFAKVLHPPKERFCQSHGYLPGWHTTSQAVINYHANLSSTLIEPT